MLSRTSSNAVCFPLTYLFLNEEVSLTHQNIVPVSTQSGHSGLLATGQLGDEVEKLADLTEEIEKYRDNIPMMNALYRDYSFLASAYLLEPCHIRFMKGEPYGLARSFLPAQLSRPIARCAEL